MRDAGLVAGNFADCPHGGSRERRSSRTDALESIDRDGAQEDAPAVGIPRAKQSSLAGQHPLANIAPMVEKKQSRSEITKANILKAARERFAADGYERTTIRAVAGDAGIDPALVMRYFANKEGLFAAAADFQLGLPSFDGIARSRIGRALVAHFLDRWEGDDNLKALLRAAATNPDAAKRLQQLFARQLLPAVGRLCTDQESAATRAGLVGSQALGLALTRYILKLPPVVGMSREELIDWIGPTLQRYLTASG